MKEFNQRVMQADFSMAVAASPFEYQPGKKRYIVTNADTLPAMRTVRVWAYQVYSLRILCFALKFSYLLPENNMIAPDHNIQKTASNNPYHNTNIRKQCSISHKNNIYYRLLYRQEPVNINKDSSLSATTNLFPGRVQRGSPCRKTGITTDIIDFEYSSLGLPGQPGIISCFQIFNRRTARNIVFPGVSGK